MCILKVLLILLCSSVVTSQRVVGWWVGDIRDPVFPINKFPWEIYTHIRIGYPIVLKNGTAYCNKTDHKFHHVLNLAHKHNTKVIWGPGVDMHDVLWNRKKTYVRDNYINSIGTAVRECHVDGIGVDYEFQDSKYMNIGVVTPEESTHYSLFLADIKKSIGAAKEVSADVSIWGVGEGNYLLGILPWINATILNNGGFDFINTMSYHWNNNGNLWSWRKDGWFIDAWRIDRKRVNIGIPYFSKHWQGDKLIDEPLWKTLSQSCPNIDIHKNICKQITFVGKKMNYDIGAWIRQEGFGGAFPWAGNYDSIEFNNTLVYWLAEGMGIK